MIRDFFTFRKMLMPSIIMIVYWLGLFVCISSAIVQFYYLNVWRALIALLIGPIVLRVICEISILMFKIHDTLLNIQQKINSRD